jgi:alkaline phosphatase
VVRAPEKPPQIYRIRDRHTHQPLQKSSNSKANDDELSTEYWHAEAKKVLDEQLKKVANTKKAKNIIFFLGDGMSHPSVGK